MSKDKVVKIFRCNQCLSSFTKVVAPNVQSVKCVFKSCGGTADIFERKEKIL